MRSTSLCLLLSTLAVAQAAAQPSPAGRERELLAADSAWSASAATPSAFVARLADDAWYLLPGERLMRGRKRALESILADSSLGGVRMSWKAARAVVSADGTFGATLGYLTLASRDGGASAAKYIAAWRHGASGWEVAAWVLTLSPAGDQTFAPAGFGADAARFGGASDGVDAARAEVIRTDAEFSARSAVAGLGAAFAEYAAADAAVLSAGEPGITWGRAAIDESNRSTPRSVLLAWVPVDGAAAASADLGFTVGQATIASAAPGHPLRLTYSKYLTIWKREPSGEWRYVADGGNRVPAP